MGSACWGCLKSIVSLTKKMRSACLRLRAKGIRCFCRTAFAVERDMLARVVPSRPSSMGPTSSIPHGKSMHGEGCSLGLKFFAAGVEGVSGFLAEGLPPSPSERGVWCLRVFDCTHSSVC